MAIHRWLSVQRRRQVAQLSASPTHTLRVQTGERLAEPIGVCRALNATSGNLTELVIAPCDADTQSGRAKLCHHLTQWLCHQGWSAAVAYLLAKVLLILVTTLSH